MAIKTFNWENPLNRKDIKSQVEIFNETLMNVLSNFVPNKIITFRDIHPPWMNDVIKNKVKFKHKL